MIDRKAYCRKRVNAGFGDALDIKFEPLGWENTLASTGRPSQSVINQEIDRCDVFSLAADSTAAARSPRHTHLRRSHWTARWRW